MNVDHYMKDLDALIDNGELLYHAIQHGCFPQEFAREAKKSWGDKAEKVIQALPSFGGEYQSWYSEAKALVRQLLPDRLSDFTRYYEKPKSRKAITYENYTIEDHLQGLNVTLGTSKVVGPDVSKVSMVSEHVRLSGQRKCHIVLLAMITDGSHSTRSRFMGGLRASMYFFAVSRWMPSSRATPRIDNPLNGDNHSGPCCLTRRCYRRFCGF